MKHHLAQVFGPDDSAAAIVRRFLMLVVQSCAIALCICVPARAGSIPLAPDASRALDAIYGGDPDTAIAITHGIERAQPEDPLGYLLEAEARWWQLFCQQNEIRYGMVDVWDLPKEPDDPPYLEAARKAAELAEAQLAKDPTARAYLYAGMGYALEARIHGLRGERMDTAKAGVNAREHLLKAIELDPELTDADTGLGLYNYYVDTLSPIVKLLRFFLGIPGGSKQQGMRQLRSAMEHGTLTAVLFTALWAVNAAGAGAIGAVFYAAHCPDDSPFFVASWYAIAIGAVTILGAFAGRRMLRW